jgi:predicted lipase
MPYAEKGTPFLVTGHSLGGALAAVCALDLSLSGLVDSSVLKLYTFGEPRVGDKLFAAAVDIAVPNAYRVVHWEDIVPHLPPEDAVIEHYLHHEHEIWYNEAFTSFTTCTGNEDPNCSDSTNPLTRNVPDHLHYFNFPISQSCKTRHKDE